MPSDVNAGRAMGVLIRSRGGYYTYFLPPKIPLVIMGTVRL
jgi:hypothetical protein